MALPSSHASSCARAGRASAVAPAALAAATLLAAALLGLWLSASTVQAAEPSMATGRSAEPPGFAQLFVNNVGFGAWGRKADGTVWGWGDNANGVIGTGTAAAPPVSTPVPVPALNGALDIQGSYIYAAALMPNGTVMTWGSNADGELGDGSATSTTRLTPQTVPGLTGVVQIAVGGAFVVVRKADGTVWSWGGNWNGQLGAGIPTSTNYSTVPVQLTTLTGARSVVASEGTGGAIMADGTVRVWGKNDTGFIGDNTTTDQITPITLAGLADVRSLGLGSEMGAAIVGDGTLWTWGADANGEMGNGAGGAVNLPTQLAGLGAVRSLRVGWANIGVVKPDGTVWVWGANWTGQIGDGTHTSRTSPYQLAALTGARSFHLGNDYVMAVLSTGGVRSQGNNVHGELADGSTTERTSLVASVFTFGSGYSKVAASPGASSYGIKTDGTVWAWGDNQYGQLGDGTNIDRLGPVQIPALAGAREIVAGTRNAFALMPDGSVKAWGDNSSGQLGDGTTARRRVPVTVAALAGARQVVAGTDFTLALMASGSVLTWGANASGQLATGNTTPRTTPTAVAGLANARQLFAGSVHAGAIMGDGTVRVWGENSDGEIGDTTQVDKTSATTIASLAGARQLALGPTYTLAVASDGLVTVWGDNSSGQLGDGTGAMHTAPVAIAGLRARDVQAGTSRSMIIGSDGVISGAGANAEWNVGDGTTNPRTSYVPATNVTSIGLLSLGGFHGMTITTAGAVKGWARNTDGQLGDCTTTNRAALVSIAVVGCAPNGQFSATANAQVGATHATSLTLVPRFSWLNSSDAAVDRQRTQVVTDPLDDVIGLWHLDTASGTTADASGNGHTLTMSGTTSATPGQTGFGQALATGTTGVASAAPAADLDVSDEFTVDAWFRSTSEPTTPYGKLVTKIGAGPPYPTNYSLELNKVCECIAFSLSSGAGTSFAYEMAPSGALLDGQWHHVAGTWDRTTAKLYLDGVLADSDPFAGPVDTLGQMSIGADIGGGNRHPGDVDEVRLVGRALTASEIAGYVVTRAPHGSVLWDSDTSDTGVALGSSCGSTVRCADVVYGATGTPTALRNGPARYYARAKARLGAGTWTSWSDYDWFETGAPPAAPTAQFTNDVNATAGTTNPANIVGPSTRFTWLNNAGTSVTAERTKLLTSPSSNVVALWHFDGTGADSTGNGHEATFTNGSPYTTGMPGMSQALRLDSTNSGTSPYDPAFNLTTFSVETWFRSTQPGTGYPVMVSKQNGGATRNFQLVFDRFNNTLNGSVISGGTTYDAGYSTNGLLDGGWHHVAMTVDDASKKLRLYIDGALRSTVTFTGTVDTPSEPIRFKENGFTGDLDDVRISSVVRSAGEIAGYYRTQLPHMTTVWDSDPTDAGNAIASCGTGTRCANTTYTGGSSIFRAGARYYATQKLLSTTAGWSQWSAPDWFDVLAPAAPTAQFTNNTNASAGSTQPTNITSSTPHLSWLNSSGLAATRQRTQVVTDTLANVVALWRGNSDLSDGSGNGRTLSAASAGVTPAYVWGSPGGFDRAMSFDGTNDVVTALPEGAYDLANDFTVDAWFQPDTLPGVQAGVLAQKTTGAGGCSAAACHFSIELSSGGTLVSSVSNGTTKRTVSTPSAGLVGGWHHVALVVDGTNTLRMYLDGASVGTPVVTTGGVQTTAGNTVYVGGSNGANYFDGQLDEVRYSSVAYTAGEISAYYRTGKPHAYTVWDSDTSDAGVAYGSSCANAARCGDVVYGATGTPSALVIPGARYYARTRVRSTATAPWSVWSAYDWFETASAPAAPSGMFTNDTNASGGSTNAATIAGPTPRFTHVNNAGVAAIGQRTQVLTTPSAGVVGLWHFDGDLADASGNGRSVVADPAPANPGFATGATGFGQALDPDGAGDRASLLYDPAFDLDTFTVEAWFRMDSFGSDDRLVVKGTAPTDRNFELFMFAPNNVCMSLSASGVKHDVCSAVPKVADGNPHHIAMTASAAKAMGLYVDGVLVGSDTFVGSVDKSVTDLEIGTNTFSGELDELRVSNVARSAAEIAGYYRTQLPHMTAVWDSSPDDMGAALTSCNSGSRCANVTFGGTAGSLKAGARYFVTQKLLSASGWSAWSAADWFQMLLPGAPTAQFTNDTNASSGAANPLNIGALAPHMSWTSNAGAGVTVNRQRTQIVTDTLSNVVGLWHLDGDRFDAAGYGGLLGPPAGTVAPTYVAGQTNFGQAATFNGSSTALRAKTAPRFDLVNDFTVDSWFRAPAGVPAGNLYITEKGGGGNRNFALYLTGGQGRVSFIATTAGGDQYLASTRTLLDGGWHHAAVSVSSANVATMYVDGVLENSVPLGGPVTGGMGQSVVLGRYGTSAGGWFQGEIDELRISNVARSAAEVKGYYSTGRPHTDVVWDSDATDAGVALAACANAARCADTVYGGPALDIRDARYFVREKHGVAGGGVWSDWSAYDWFETESVLDVGVTAGAVQSVGNILQGGRWTGASSLSVSSNQPTGYTLSATGPSDSNALQSGANAIPRFSALPGSPGPWVTAPYTPGFGMSVLAQTGGKNTTTWGTGTTDSDIGNLNYVGLRSSSSQQLFTRAGAVSSLDTVDVAYRLDVPASQTAGTYTGVVTYTALANP